MADIGMDCDVPVDDGAESHEPEAVNPEVGTNFMGGAVTDSLRAHESLKSLAQKLWMLAFMEGGYGLGMENFAMFLLKN